MKGKINKSILILVALTPLAHAAVSTNTVCFLSQENIRLELHTYFDPITRWRGGFVRKPGVKEIIPIVFHSSNYEIVSSKRPYDATTTWIEVYKGEVSGRYEMGSQGANIYSMIYTDRLTGKTTSFGWASEVGMSVKNECQWE